MNIKQFGYDIFKAEPGTFAPVEIMPVGPEYLCPCDSRDNARIDGIGFNKTAEAFPYLKDRPFS